MENVELRLKRAFEKIDRAIDRNPVFAKNLLKQMHKDILTHNLQYFIFPLYNQYFLRFIEKEPKHARSLFESFFDQGAYEFPSFWSVLKKYIKKYPSRSKDFHKFFLKGAGLLSSNMRTFKKYVEAAATYLEVHPEKSKTFANLFDRFLKHDLFGNPMSWELLRRYIDKHPSVSRTFYEIFQKSFSKGWHDSSLYFKALNSFIRSYPQEPHKLKKLFIDIYKKGVSDFRSYSLALRSFSDYYPDFSKEVIDYLYDRKRYRDSAFWKLPHPVVKIQDKVREQGYVSPEIKGRLEEWKHPHSRYLRSLLKARAWYVKELFTRPHVKYSVFVDMADFLESRGIKVGWRVAKKLFENTPFLLILSPDDLKNINPKNAGDFFRKVREIAVKKFRNAGFTKKFISSDDLKYLPHVVAYREYKEDIEKLPSEFERLFNYKFFYAPQGLRDRIFRAVKDLEEKKLFLVTADISGMIEALKEEARRENLFGKKDEYSLQVQSIYRRILSNVGSLRSITDRELDLLRNTKRAGEVGIQRTVSKILSIVENARLSRGRIRIARTVPQHLAYMNLVGCMAADGSFSDGAVSVTGGPALVVGLEGHHGDAIGRVVLTLWSDGKNYVFVPNHVYGVGGKEFMDKIREIFHSHGIKVHDSVIPPVGFSLVRSKHTRKRFWKDGLKNKGCTFP